MAEEGRPAERRKGAGAVGGRMACLVLAATALACAAVMLYRHLRSEERVRLSRANCRLLPARVVNKGKSLEEHGGMQFPVYLVRYAFNFRGARLEGRGRVSREWYNWLERGGEVEVYVDASDPRRNFLKLEYDLLVGRPLRITCLVGGIGLALAVCAAFRGLLRKVHPARRSGATP